MKRFWAGAAVAGAAGTAAQLIHMRRVGRDPARRALEHPPRGQPLLPCSADGTQLYAELFGPPDGQIMVLVHGWIENRTYWIYVIRELTSRGFRIVAPDLRGHGNSKPAASNDYSLERFGEDVEAVLEATVAEGEHAVLAGHSLGAMSIVAWAEHHEVSRRAGAVALINTGIGNLVNEHVVVPTAKLSKTINELVSVRGFLAAPGRMPQFSTPLGQALTRYVAFGPDANPAQIAFFERMIASASWRVRADTGLAMSRMELHHALPRLNVPTLVLAGEKDRLTPASHARRIAQELPALHALVVLEGSAHMAPLECPQEVCDALLDLAAVARAARPAAV